MRALGRSRGVVAVVTVVAAMTLLLSCGSGGDSNDAKESSSTTDPSDSSTSSTASTLPSTPQTDAASLTAADLGSTWRVYPDAPASEAAGGTDDGCAGAEAEAAADAATASTDGDLLQRGELDRYVQTVTYEFGDAADATAFAASLLTDTYIECVRSATEAGLTKEPVQTVKTYGVTRDADGAFVGQYGLEFDEEIDGTQQFGGAYAVHSIYAKGSIVIDVFFQAISRGDDPPDLNDSVDAEIDAGMQKVLRRITA